MPISRALTGVALALAALSATPASAQLNDLSPKEIEAITKYGLPVAFDGFRQRCASQLSPDGFVMINEGRLEQKFAQGAQNAWPEAKSVLLNIASRDSDGASEMLAGLPDEALRPFVDGMVANLVAQEIKPEQCSDIERGLELLDPMPVENLAGLIGFIVEMDAREKAKRRAATENRDRRTITE